MEMEPKIVATPPTENMDVLGCPLLSSSTEWKSIDCNPHCFQAKENSYNFRTDIVFKRVLAEDDPQGTYRRRKGESKTVLHWGQRKLLMSEIEFLTEFGHLSNTVVYAGAAPGTHTNYLARMFPNHKFVLVDPAPFTCRESSQVLIRQELFTDELAKEFEGRNVLFVSDIRAADPELMSEKETDQQVAQDMTDQKRWHEIMKPVKSMLKFRLSWKPGKTTYLAGDIYFPIWGPITTTEARLITTGGDKEYDNTKYEGQMFFFNTETRVAVYPHNVTGEGIDHCYDCAAEIWVLYKYLMNIKKIQTDNIWKDISDMSYEISRQCAKDRTLLSGNLDPGDRKSKINHRQFIQGEPAYVHAKKKDRNHEDERESDFGVSDFARKQMEKMNFQKGKGLGKNGQGITSALAVDMRSERRGLGYDHSEATVNFLDRELPARSPGQYERRPNRHYTSNKRYEKDERYSRDRDSYRRDDRWDDRREREERWDDRREERWDDRREQREERWDDRREDRYGGRGRHSYGPDHSDHYDQQRSEDRRFTPDHKRKGPPEHFDHFEGRKDKNTRTQPSSSHN